MYRCAAEIFLVATMILSGGLDARAGEGSPRLRVADGLPFSPDELQEAVRLRSPRGQPVVAGQARRVVSVQPAGPGEVAVSCGQSRRIVSLQGRTGAAAARRVALAIVDLVEGKLAIPEPSRGPSSQRAAPARRRDKTKTAVVKKATAAAEGRPRPARAGSPALDVGLLASFGGGTNWERPTAVVAVDGSFRLVGPLRGAASIGPAMVPGATLDQVDVSLVALQIRLGLAWRPADGGLEIRATGMA